MRAPVSWLAEHAVLPAGLGGRDLAEAFVRAGLEVEAVEQTGADVTGPVVVGRVLSAEPEQHSNGKTVNWCRVDVGDHNEAAVAAGDALPTGVLLPQDVCRPVCSTVGQGLVTRR